MRRVSGAIAALLLAALAWIGVDRLCAIPFRDNLAMREIDERTDIAQSADPQQAIVLARTNLADLERTVRSHALDPAWYLLFGANCELLGRWQDAANAYTRALSIDQRPEIYFNRGLALLHLGHVEAATADLVIAVRFNPTFIEQIDGELRARVAKAAGLP
jgi:tetratricopeptide (TPR) repeat protein